MEGSEPKGAGRPDEEAIYRQVGLFVVIFQALENELSQLASFALDPGHTGHGRRSVAELWFSPLVDMTETSVGEFLDEHRGAEPEFRKRLQDLLARCRELAGHRNKVVHSAYVFLEAGGELVAILRSDMTRGANENEVELDQELLTEDSFNKAMSEITQVAFEIAQCRLQLIHWYKPGPAS